MKKLTEMTEQEIIDILTLADDNYHNGIAIMSDAEYDRIKDYAIEKYSKNPYFLSVGAPVKSSKEKVSLPYVLGSLKKYKAGDSDKDITRWLSKYNKEESVVITAKLDGASSYIESVKGRIIRACTRGDGSEGFLITDKIKRFVNSPNSDKNDDVRGEIVWLGNEYEKLNFSNRRNAVSGIINSDDGKYSEKLTFIAHEVINSDIKKEEDRLKYLKSIGFEIPYYEIYKIKDINEEFLTELLKKFKEHYKDVLDIDGLVLTRNESVRENIYYPEHKIAFKVNEEATEGIVDHIEWNMTRTGKVVPVVILKEKLLLAGAFVERVTAHNAKYIVDKKIGKGSKILVMRSGEVIPFISGVVTPSPEFSTIVTCPSCFHTLKWNETGVDLVCSNPNCSDKDYFRTENYIKVMGIDGISVQTLRNLSLETIYSLYEVDEKYILSHERFGKRSCEKILKQIYNSLVNVDPIKFLAALGIENLGIKNADKVTRYLMENKKVNGEEIVESFFKMIPEDFVNIPGFGEKMAVSIFNEMKESLKLFNWLKRKNITFKNIEDKKQNSVSKISGKNIVLTGGYKIGRDELKNIIEENGGIVQNSVNSKTNILVCEDENSNSSKMKKAKELLKTKKDFIITQYDDFMNYLN